MKNRKAGIGQRLKVPTATREHLSHANTDAMGTEEASSQLNTLKTSHSEQIKTCLKY